jgi:addiction module RelE/StbE family toxin
VLTLLWSTQALEDLQAITDYIGERNQTAADGLIERITFCAERLTQFPYMHRAGRVPGTREAVINSNYVLIYRVTADVVTVLGVLHTRQQYP